MRKIFACLMFLLCASVRPVWATLISTQPEAQEEGTGTREEASGQTTIVSSELPVKKSSPNRDEITKKLQAHPDAAQYLEAITQMVQKYNLQMEAIKQAAAMKLKTVRVVEKDALKPFEYEAEWSRKISDLTNQMLEAFDVLKAPAGFEKSHEVLTKYMDLSREMGEAHLALAKYYEQSVKPSFDSLLFKVESKKFLDELTGIDVHYPTQARQDTYDDWRKKFVEDLNKI